MKRTLKYFVVCIVVFCAAFIGCKKKVQPGLSEINKECDCAEEVSADFTMEESASAAEDLYTISDTVYADKYVRFTALQKDAEYIWQIGAETITQPSFSRYFPASLAWQNLPMTLIVKKKPNKICYPNDDGIDTITKILHLAEAFTMDSFFNSTNSRYEGVFRVKEKNASDSIDIILDLFDDGFFNSLSLRLNVDGLKSGYQYRGDTGGINYTQCWFDGFARYPNVSVCSLNNIVFNYFKINKNKTIELQVDLKVGNSCTSEFYFGRKL